MRTALFSSAVILLAATLTGNAQTMQTAAGGSYWSTYAGDGLPATDPTVRFFRTAGICADAAGNIYIADWGNYRIRKVNAATGILSTIAGDGTAGFSGDGSPATAAKINGMMYPMALTIDNSGNIFYGDNGNNRIRKISTATGIITTVVGGGSSSSDGIPATSASVSFNHIYVDAAGNIYFTSGSKIKKVTASTGLISTLAGSTAPGFSGDGGPATSAMFNNPDGITGDASGNIYVVDEGNSRVRKINTAGIISTIAGSGTPGYTGDGGPATSATLNSPRDIGIDVVQNLYFLDGSGKYIRKIEAATGIITTVAGCNTGCPGLGYTTTPVPATSAQTSGEHLFVDGFGNLYFTNYGGQASKVTLGTISCGAYMTPGVVSSTTDIATCATTIYNSGYSPAVTFQWQKSTDNATWTALAGATSSSCNFSSLSGAAYYRCATTCPTSSVTASTAAVHMYASSLMTQSVINSPDTSCSGPDFFVTACGTAATYSVKTSFGDGTSNVTPLSATGVSCAHVPHNFYHSGTYFVKQVLMNGAASVDSVSFPYNYTYCKTLPVKFYFDANFDCSYNTGDLVNYQAVKTEVDSSGIPVDTIYATSGFFYKANGAAGTVYTFKVISTLPGLHITCPASGMWTDTIKYYVNTYPVKYIGLNCSGAPGFDLSVSGLLRFASHSGLGDLVVTNAYCTPTTAMLSVEVSPKYSHGGMGGSTYSSTISGNIRTWTIPSLSSAIGAPVVLHFGFGHPGSTLQPAGDTIHATVKVSPIAGDANPSNNIVIRCDTVKYAFDPNEITVTPAGCYSNDTQFQYFVRFENDGNTAAKNIFVLDTLSDYLDPGTFELVSATHEMYLSKYRDGGHTVIKFDFPNINLADSTHHDECFGIIIYNIRPQTSLPNGTTIEGRVGIYFEDNDVVMTNTATVQKGCATINNVNEIARNGEVSLFPNPAFDKLNVSFERGAYRSYIIENAVGQVLGNGYFSANQTKIDISTIPTGVYYISLVNDDAKKVLRFVKM